MADDNKAVTIDFLSNPSGFVTELEKVVAGLTSLTAIATQATQGLVNIDAALKNVTTSSVGTISGLDGVNVQAGVLTNSLSQLIASLSEVAAQFTALPTSTALPTITQPTSAPASAEVPSPEAVGEVTAAVEELAEAEVEAVEETESLAEAVEEIDSEIPKTLAELLGDEVAPAAEEAAQGVNGLGDVLWAMLPAITVSVSALGMLAGAGRFLMQSMAEAGNEQQLVNSFSTLLGSTEAAESRLRDLGELSGSIFTGTELEEASLTMQRLGGDALGSAEGVKLVADAAAKLDPSALQSMSDKVGTLYAGLQQGLPIGGSISQLMEMGVITADTAGKITAMQKAGASGESMWALALADLQRFNGGMDEVSGTFNGSILALKNSIASTFKDLMISVGTPLIEAITPAIVATKNFIESMKPTLLGIVEGVKSAIATIANLFASGNLSEAFWLAIQVGAAGAVEWLLAALIKVFEVAGQILMNVIMRAADPAMWMAMFDIFASIPQMLIGALGMLGSILLQALSQPLDFLVASLQYAGSLLGDALFDAGMALKGIFLDASLAFVSKIAGIAAKVGIDLSGAVDGLVKAKNDFQTEVDANSQGERAGFTETLTDLQAQGGALGMAGIDPEESFKASEQMIANGFNQGLDGLKTRMGQLSEDILTPIVDGVADIKPLNIFDTSDQAAKLQSLITSAMPGVADAAKDEAEDAAGPFKSGKPGESGTGDGAPVVADSLTAVGGGGGFGGGGLNPMEAQTAAIETQTASVREQTLTQGSILEVLIASRTLLEKIANSLANGGGGVSVEAT